ncbi:MAG TPA: AAA family ATPase [Gemmataceae bacterium]|nr:AAA family ATPase [Gemmataceae bacterium]
MPVLKSTRCADLTPAPVHWLWKPYIARGKLAILDGDPGTGKSFVTLDLAARLGRGDRLPDGQPLDRPHVTLLLNAEDDATDTILPRAAAAGAELGRLHVIAPGLGLPHPPQFPEDLPALEALIYEHCADLVVIDPVMAFLQREVWANSDQSVRRALTPLAALAADTGCAVLLVRHLTKTGGSKAIYRGSGSIGIMGAVRTGLMVGRHPDDPELRVLTMPKTNIGLPARSLGFRLVGDTASGQGRLEWVGPVDLSADELCVTERDRTRPRDRAKEWLKQQLAGGTRKAGEIEAAAAASGIAARTLDRAKAALGVISEQRREGERSEWWWHDPAVSSPKRELGDLPPLRALEDLEDLFPFPKRRSKD